MVMGKGGVGKTTIAGAVAVELASRGHDVHLTTTDPAAHVAAMIESEVDHLQVSRIDPQVETDRYRQHVWKPRARTSTLRAGPCSKKTCARPAPKRSLFFRRFPR